MSQAKTDHSYTAYTFLPGNTEKPREYTDTTNAPCMNHEWSYIEFPVHNKNRVINCNRLTSSDPLALPTSATIIFATVALVGAKDDIYGCAVKRKRQYGNLSGDGRLPDNFSSPVRERNRLTGQHLR